jgi:hypothetical protein
MSEWTNPALAAAPSRPLGAARGQSDARYLHLLNSNLFGVGVGDFAGNCTDANGALLDMLGYTRAELEAGKMRWIDLTPEEYRQRDAQALAEARATGVCRAYEKDLFRKDGSRVPLLVNFAVAPDDPECLVVSLVDLTKQKQVEQELRASETRARLLVDGNKEVAFYMLDPAGHVTTWNAGAERICGYRADEILGRHFSVFHPPESLALGNPPKLLEQAGLGRVEAEGWRIRKDGTRFWADSILTAIRDDDGALLGFANITKDITARRRTEVLLSATLDNVIDGIIGIDEHGKIESFNAAAEKMFGYQAREVIGKNVKVLMPEPYHSEHDSYLANYMNSGEAKVIGIGRQVVAKRKDGTTFPVDLAVSEFVLYDRRHFTGAVRDITTQRKLEEQLRQAQKLEVIGRLAGGVAHDFNNLLTVILGYGELLLESIPQTDELWTCVEAINESGRRAAALTRQLLAFGRQTVLEPKLLEMNDVVRDTEKMLRRLIGEDVILATVLDAKSTRVLVDPGQIGQVLMNLAINARDAMPRGGRLTIETQNVELDADYARLHPGTTRGSFVRLTMSDTGCGMTPEVKARIFEPFFTTKASGIGTGLGLATVYGIVKQSNGHIDVYSEPGMGTTIKILLPAAEQAAEAEERSGESPRAHKGSETILLVEDDDQVRRMALFTLERHGYDVLPASRGSEAVDIVENRSKPIDLVLTDVVMPEMSGRQLVEKLRARLAGAKVMFMSGYTDDAVIRHGILQAEVAFLQKPFTPAGLARKVREVLDHKGPVLATLPIPSDATAAAPQLQSPNAINQTGG